MNHESKRLPNLLIPGYHKAGTTTLFTELAKHPDIFPSLVKEPFYFRPYINGKTLPPIEEYISNFAAAKGETYRMEGSPTYIYGGEKAARKIQEVLGDVKLIISLRNPIDQLFSLYKHKLRFLEIDENESFYSFVTKREDHYRQFYDLHLTAWFNVFGDNIKCIFFDSLIKDPVDVLANIVEWLDLPPLEVDTERLVNTNPGGTYRNKFTHKLALAVFHKTKDHIPHALFLALRKLYFRLNGRKVRHTLSDDAREYLEALFLPHNQAVHALLSQRGYTEFPDWLIKSIEEK